eukprot:TRINITY_DN89546_c0_g1_i1.p1 TRINITY_DN89546_c0_g1~~TRINITY_DN89546_c0_g1_i1.p1  ORF type:complete len:312 (+),score=73.32 TRINITY_DN89546_c0_g1_i1:126-1061(+)
MGGYGKDRDGAGSKGGSRKGASTGKGGSKSSKGDAAGRGYASRASDWDAAQLRNLAEDRPSRPLDLARVRPQRRVEAFPHLTVAADWPESKPPRSGSAFYLPLIWTALLPESMEEASSSAAVAQLAQLGDGRHFHNGAVRRSTLEDVLKAQVYWRQVFSGWEDWARRMRTAMSQFVAQSGERGLAGVVAAHVQTTSVTAGALIYGDLHALGALPHISNARRSPDQDAILELDFAVRMEVEASVHTLFVQGGDVIAAETAPLAAAAAALQAPAGQEEKTLGSSLDSGGDEPEAATVGLGAAAEKSVSRWRRG